MTAAAVTAIRMDVLFMDSLPLLSGRLVPGRAGTAYENASSSRNRPRRRQLAPRANQTLRTTSTTSCDGKSCQTWGAAPSRSIMAFHAEGVRSGRSLPSPSAVLSRDS